MTTKTVAQALAKHCQHWYWDVNARYHYRRCKFCSAMQYNYTGEWKPEIKFVQFVAKWTPLDGHQFIPRVTIEACQLFEFQCYETWGVAFKVRIDGQEFGTFGNLNQADKALEEWKAQTTSTESSGGE